MVIHEQLLLEIPPTRHKNTYDSQRKALVSNENLSLWQKTAEAICLSQLFPH